jgi:peptidyl-prolyl cis-trans isomerase B (cyclophilin B)
MTTKKQSKANERKRYEQLQLKIEQRRQRRARNWRMAGIVLIALMLGAVIWWAVSAASTDDPSPVADPTATATGLDDDDATDPTDAATDDDLNVAEGWGTSPAPPQPDSAQARTWTVELDTNQGPITMELDGAAAPQAVASFVALAGDGFFNQTDCHRLVTAGIYVLQCGDPTGTGTGGPTYRFGPVENAPADDVYPAGTLAMARQGGNAESMGSQFFIVYDDSTIPSDAAGGYSVFGVVTEGLAIVEQVAQSGTIEGGTDGRPSMSVIINEVSVS